MTTENFKSNICAHCMRDISKHNKNSKELNCAIEFANGAFVAWGKSGFEDSGIKTLHDASPDMFEMLKKMDKWFTDTYEVSAMTDAEKEFWNEIKATLKKAKPL